VPLNEFYHLERVKFRAHIQHRYAVGQTSIQEFWSKCKSCFDPIFSAGNLHVRSAHKQITSLGRVMFPELIHHI